MEMSGQNNTNKYAASLCFLNFNIIYSLNDLCKDADNQL